MHSTNQSTLISDIVLHQNGDDHRQGGGRDGIWDSPRSDAEMSVIRVEPWEYADLEDYGHHPRSPYVELFWLSMLGPTSTWLLRRLSLLLEQSPKGFDLDIETFAREIGLGGRSALKTAFGRALDRCCRFGLTQKGRGSTLFVRRRIPSISPRMVERLTPGMRAIHDQCIATIGKSWHSEELTRAKKIASVLHECGDSPDRIESQMHALQFHPALAFEASRWAALESLA